MLLFFISTIQINMLKLSKTGNKLSAQISTKQRKGQRRNDENNLRTNFDRFTVMRPNSWIKPGYLSCWFAEMRRQIIKQILQQWHKVLHRRNESQLTLAQVTKISAHYNGNDINLLILSQMPNYTVSQKKYTTQPSMIILTVTVLFQ